MAKEWRRKVETLLCMILVIWIRPGHTLLDIGNIGCSDVFDDFKLSVGTNEAKVKCPSSCLDENYIVKGSGPYTSSSSVCCAAIHNGTLTNSKGGNVIIIVSHSSIPYFIGSERNGVKSKHDFLSRAVTFITRKIPQEETSSVNSTTRTITGVTQPQLEETTEDRSTELDSVENPEGIEENTIPESTTRSYQRHISTTTEKGGSSQGNVLSNDLGASTMTLNIREDFFGLSKLKIIGLLIGVFAAGVATTLFICIVKKRRKIQRRFVRSGCGIRKKHTSQRVEEGDICVCYQNMNSSKQGLLYDPETCDRPCPIRKPQDDDSFMREEPLNLVHSESFIHKASEKVSCKSAKCEIRYDDACASGCSGACNPAQFDF